MAIDTTVPESTGWKPRFGVEGVDPWEGMPQEYVEREAASFVPSEATPEPPSQQTEEGRAARERAPEVSREKASIQNLSNIEDYAKFQALQDEEKFVKLQELGKIESAIMQMSNAINAQAKIITHILSREQTNVQSEGNTEGVDGLPIQSSGTGSDEDTSGSGEQGLLSEPSDS